MTATHEVYDRDNRSDGVLLMKGRSICHDRYHRMDSHYRRRYLLCSDTGISDSSSTGTACESRVAPWCAVSLAIFHRIGYINSPFSLLLADFPRRRTVCLASKNPRLNQNMRQIATPSQRKRAALGPDPSRRRLVEPSGRNEAYRRRLSSNKPISCGPDHITTKLILKNEWIR